jgi:hypothetical protein
MPEKRKPSIPKMHSPATRKTAHVRGEAVVAEAGSGSSVQLRARKSDGQKAARKGDNHGAWQRMGLKQTRQTLRQQAECLAASFGEVRDFFTRNRCSSLDRMMFAIVDEAGTPPWCRSSGWARPPPATHATSRP